MLALLCKPRLFALTRQQRRQSAPDRTTVPKGVETNVKAPLKPKATRWFRWPEIHS